MRCGIGFTDSFNPFYLFSKMNVGLLLLAPSTTTMREEQPFMIALVADNRILRPIAVLAGFGSDSSVTKVKLSRVALQTTGEIPAGIRF